MFTLRVFVCFANWSRDAFGQITFSAVRWLPFRISVFANIHLSKRANITHTNNGNGEITEEIYVIQRLRSNIKEQYERRCYRTQQLGEEIKHSQLEKLPEMVSHVTSVSQALPSHRQIVSVR